MIFIADYLKKKTVVLLLTVALICSGQLLCKPLYTYPVEHQLFLETVHFIIFGCVFFLLMGCWMSGCRVCSSKQCHCKLFHICIPPTGVYSPRGAYSKGRGTRPRPPLPAPRGAHFPQVSQARKGVLVRGGDLIWSD